MTPETDLQAELVAWLQAKVTSEYERLKALGLSVALLPVKNFSLVIEGTDGVDWKEGGRKPYIVNRCEFDCKDVDLAKVLEIKYSPPFACPLKKVDSLTERWDYRHVLLLMTPEAQAFNPPTSSSGISVPNPNPSKDCKDRKDDANSRTSEISTANVLIFPYLYQQVYRWRDAGPSGSSSSKKIYNLKNKLTQWLLIDAENRRTRHQVKEFV